MRCLIKHAVKYGGDLKLILTCRPKLNYADTTWIQIELHGLKYDETKSLMKARGLTIDDKTTLDLHELTQGHPLWLNLIATQVITNKANISDLIKRIKLGRDAGLPSPMLQEIWKTLTHKQITLLRYMAEIIRPVTERRLSEFVKKELTHNKFTQILKQLKALDLVVVKTRQDASDIIELHPLVREFVRRQYSHSERSPYIENIILFFEKIIIQLRPELAKDTPYSVIENWITKVELLINDEKYTEAILVLDEIQIPLLRKGCVEEFVRLAIMTFNCLEWTPGVNVDMVKYDEVFRNLIEVLSHLGRCSETEKYIGFFERGITGGTARYIAFCEIRCTAYWLQKEFDLAKEWGKRGVELKTSSNLDTRHDCKHSLALAQRDSGEVEAALEHLLMGHSIESVVDSNQIESTYSGSYYGNIGRCLFLLGKDDEALVCLLKSALKLEKATNEDLLLNQGWAALWIGAILERKSLYSDAYVCYKRAYNKWKDVSPVRAEEALDAANRMATATNVSSLQCQEDWKIERKYLDWISRTKQF